MKRITIIGGIVIGVTALAAAAWNFGAHPSHKTHGNSAHSQLNDGNGTVAHLHADGQHDEKNMPGLIGETTTENEVIAMQELFKNHSNITRTVENLPDGIRTITETKDEALRIFLTEHISDMLARVEDGNNPHVPIQSATLGPIFEGRDKIETTVETTPNGVIVTQTSDDAEIVRLLQTHAEEINGMVAGGMAFIHERMRLAGEAH